jgi:hypothetical protein
VARAGLEEAATVSEGKNSAVVSLFISLYISLSLSHTHQCYSPVSLCVIVVLSMKHSSVETGGNIYIYTYV